jgi:hypothetical protein
MKALKIIGVILLGLIVLVVMVALAQPAQGHVERSIVINAPVSKVYTELNSFRDFRTWSPWSKMDPEATYKFEGPESGVGAKMSWEGKKVGSGSQWITESVENQRIKNGLQFDGYDAKYFAEFVLEPQGDNATKVTWTYDGPNDGLMAKAFWVVMKGMLDSQYEEGLNNLKAVIEAK